jgi:hypothetical protein
VTINATLWKSGRRELLKGFGVVGTSKWAKNSGVRISALAKAWMSCFCHETAITKICGESGTVSLTGSGRAWLNAYSTGLGNHVIEAPALHTAERTLYASRSTVHGLYRASIRVFGVEIKVLLSG